MQQQSLDLEVVFRLQRSLFGPNHVLIDGSGAELFVQIDVEWQWARVPGQTLFTVAVVSVDCIAQPVPDASS